MERVLVNIGGWKMFVSNVGGFGFYFSVEEK